MYRMVRATQERDVLWTQDESGERRFFAWCYYVKERDRRGRHFPSQIHRIRDGQSFLTLAPALSDAGYRYAGAVLNIPAKEARGSEVIRTSKYWPGDVLLLATRPPVHDPVTPKKGDRWVDRSGYRTEQEIGRAH